MPVSGGSGCWGARLDFRVSDYVLGFGVLGLLSIPGEVSFSSSEEAGDRESFEDRISQQFGFSCLGLLRITIIGGSEKGFSRNSFSWE